MSASDFARDLGLVHEAVVTGRKVNAGRRFWASLAHSQEAFALIKPLVQHVAAIEKFKIDITVMPTAGEVGNFCKWLGKDCFNCLNEHDVVKLKLIESVLSWPEEQSKRDELMRLAHVAMPIQIRNRIRSLGIHSAEIVAVAVHPHSVNWESGFWLNDDESLGFDEDQCVEGAILIKAVVKVFDQRKFIMQMRDLHEIEKL